MVAPRTTLRRQILKLLPATVEIEGDDIEMQVVWSLKPPRDLKKPCWMVQFLRQQDLTTSLDAHEESVPATATVEEEVHLYTAGDAQTLLNEGDIDEVETVTGKLAGVDHTFVEGTDYEVVDSDDDNALDALEWLAADLPDTGTNIQVTYTHNVVEVTRAHLRRTPVIIHLIADRLKDGEQGATQDIDPTDIIDAMDEALVAWYEQVLRPALEVEFIGVGIQIEVETPFQAGQTTTLQAPAQF